MTIFGGKPATVRYVLAVLALWFSCTTNRADLPGRDYAVELTASVDANAPSITLQWPGDPNASGYVISRKLLGESQWVQIGQLDGSAAGGTDPNVQIGMGYEYQVLKQSTLGITAYGYIYSGINIPLVEDRGTIIVLAEESLAGALQPELLRLEYDLIGDGWHVERATVNATNSPPDVKALIQSIYAKDPARTHALLLFGHIPVAYSGDIMPDGHPNHEGAWPADVYYADLDGAWTDDTVNVTTAEEKRNWNVPGDGRFDQSEPPSAIELETGRVDLSRLTCFLNKSPSRSELDLARQYLDKNHRFRTGGFAVQQRAVIFDRLESITAEPISANSWRNFTPLIGQGNIQEVSDFQWFTTVSTGSYLWSGVTAGGTEVGSDHVGTSDEFALSDVNVVFTTFLGSYYGDWDVESNFLRAALGAHGTLLCNVYSGQPQWLFHPMGLNMPIGYSAKITQENNEHGIYPPHNNGAGQVHVALMGDPTLRAYPIPSVGNLQGQPTDDGIVVGWQVPVIDGFAGCLVYTASDPKGPYRRVTSDPISGSSYRIHNVSPTDYVMVKTVALTRTPSGTFYNSSIGAFYPDPLAQLPSGAPAPPANLSIVKATPSSITLSWVPASAIVLGYRVERMDPGATQFHEIAMTGADSFVDNSLAGPGLYTYRVRAFNASGNSDYSLEAHASTASGAAEFAGLDFLTQGNWLNSYGTEGFVIPGWEQQLPSNCSLVTSNVILYRGLLTNETRMPQLTNTTLRSENCWVSGTSCGFMFNFSDDQVHQVAFYLAIWTERHPLILLDAFDPVSGALLDHRALTNVDEGAYAVYNVQRQAFFQYTAPSIFTNVEVYAIFIDPARVAPLQLDPPAGAFPGRMQLTLASATPNAAIHYTTDGSDPTPDSPLYTGPFWLRASALVKARGFRDGFEPSGIVQAQYNNSVPDFAGIISSDANTAGSWPGKYGSQGVWLPMSSPAVAPLFECSLEGSSDWTWNDQTTDSRALLVGAAGGLRRARAWYSTGVMTLNLGVYDTQMHAVSLYFVDFDNGGRSEKIELLAPNGSVWDTIVLDNFAGGRYLTLGVQGQMQVRITPLHGANALLSGVFFDAAPSALSLVKPAPLTDLHVTAGTLTFTVAAFPGVHVCTDRSRDLFNWECIATNTVSGSTAQIAILIDPFDPNYFFRAHFVP